jgi:hypothetical protein
MTGRSGHEEAPWELVQSRRSLRMAFAPPHCPPPAMKTRRPPPAWLNGRCLCCHDAGHWASICCGPLRCNNCRQVGHKAKSCMGKIAPRPPPVQVRRVARMPVVVHPCPLQQLESPCKPTNLKVQSTLAAQAEVLCSELQGCLARVVTFLVQAEAALARPLVTPRVSSPSELHANSHGDSVDEGKAELYSCFSPRVGLSTSLLLDASMCEASAVVAPVLQSMSELQELCGASSVLPPMELGSS